jgi:hypothetical protein
MIAIPEIGRIGVLRLAAIGAPPEIRRLLRRPEICNAKL